MEITYKEKIEQLCNEKVCQYSIEWLRKIDSYETKAIFGAGGGGKQWISILEDHGIKLDFICDNNKNLWGTNIRNIPCISPDELLKITGKLVVVIAVRRYQDIYSQLLACGIRAENIMVANVDTLSFKANYMISKKEVDVSDICQRACLVTDMCEDDLSAKILYQTLRRYILSWDEQIDYTGEAYFIPELGMRQHEVFVDIGAYNGDTLECFLKKYKDEFDKYYAFELDRDNYERLCDKIAQMPDSVKNKIVVSNIGAWNQKAEIHYSSNQAATNVNLSGECVGYVDKLDDVLKEKSTFIKMDIEGAEMYALEGGMEHIRMYKPICAICIYHSLNDLLMIPVMLKELGYKIIIRHHDVDASEIVCYAYE